MLINKSVPLYICITYTFNTFIYAFNIYLYIDKFILNYNNHLLKLFFIKTYASTCIRSMRKRKNYYISYR
jgi:hypothetical protein